MGLNDNVECYDKLSFYEEEDGVTLMDYPADISLRGFKVLFTPFIIGALDKIA